MGILSNVFLNEGYIGNIIGFYCWVNIHWVTQSSLASSQNVTCYSQFQSGLVYISAQVSGSIL
jgi:hypothetical protein